MPPVGQKYELNISNLNSQLQHFCLFQKVLLGERVDLEVSSLAWIVGAVPRHIPGGNSATQFTWKTNYIAYISSVKNKNSPDVMETIQVSLKLDQNNRLTATYIDHFPDGFPTFKDETSDGSNGIIDISSDDEIPTSDA